MIISSLVIMYSYDKIVYLSRIIYFCIETKLKIQKSLVMPKEAQEIILT